MKRPTPPATIVMALLPALSAAQPLHAPDDIRSEVRGFLAREVGPESPQLRIEVNEPDPRLRLARCEEPLSLALPPGGPRSGSITVGVRCTGERPWSLFVPARVRRGKTT